MSLPQRPPGRGGRRAHVHFVYVPTPQGKKWPAHIAGPCMWFECHTKGRSKPCLHELTGGELTCDVCSPFEVPQTLGYQPLYHGKDGRPCMVVVHDYARDHIDALKLHHPVMVERGEGPTDTVALVPMLGAGRKYTSTLAERMQPADLTETLLRMWKMPALTEWYRITHGRGEAVPPMPPPAPPATTPPPKGKALAENDIRTMLSRHVIEQAGGEQPELIGEDAAREVLARMVKGYKKPSTNGNGKH